MGIFAFFIIYVFGTSLKSLGKKLERLKISEKNPKKSLQIPRMMKFLEQLLLLDLQ